MGGSCCLRASFEVWPRFPSETDTLFLTLLNTCSENTTGSYTCEVFAARVRLRTCEKSLFLRWPDPVLNRPTSACLPQLRCPDRCPKRLSQLLSLSAFARSIQVESLEANHEALAARARAAAQAETKALADRAEARARADSAERSAAGRVRELEEEATRLRQQLETGADAAQVRERQNGHCSLCC